MEKSNLSLRTIAIIRLVVMAITWVGTLLVTVYGWEPLPYTSEQVNTGIMLAVSIASSIWGYWKNNAITQYGQEKEELGIQELGTRKEFDEKEAKNEN